MGTRTYRTEGPTGDRWPMWARWVLGGFVAAVYVLILWGVSALVDSTTSLIPDEKEESVIDD